MNHWRSRVLFAIFLWLMIVFHTALTSNLPNDPLGMLSFHGSAALFDLFILIIVQEVFTGHLCRDMETLCIVSIVANFLGFRAYMAYAPPVYYDNFMWGITYVQFIRLLLVDGHDAHHLGVNLVRRIGSKRGGIHHRKANT